MESESVRLRREGNTLFHQSFVLGLAPAVQCRRLESALKKYNQAFAQCRLRDESASLSKNIAAVCWRLGALVKDKQLMYYYGGEACQHVFRAMREGTSTKGSSWCSALDASAQAGAVAMLEVLTDRGDRLELLRILTMRCRLVVDPCPVFVPFLWVQLGHCVFIEAVAGTVQVACTILGEAELAYRQGLAMLLRSNAACDTTRLRELRSSLEDVKVQMANVQAERLLDSAQQHMEEWLFGEEDLNLDAIRVALDMFHRILQMDGAVEQEAIASAKLGDLLCTVFRAYERGYVLCMQSIRLCESMKPKLFNHCPWYQRSVVLVEAHRRRLAEQEESARVRERGPLLEKLANELSILKVEASRGVASLLQFLFFKYPPKSEELAVLGPLDGQQIRNTLLRAIRLYHPDKNSKEKFGDLWFVLCEEICKHLNAKLEVLKCGPNE